MEFTGTFVSMATRECAAELGLFLASLRAYHPSNLVVVGVNSELLRSIDEHLVPAKQNAEALSLNRLAAMVAKDERLILLPVLDQYGSISRAFMERQKGQWFGSRHTDFMMEKANLMDWTLQRQSTSALFLDSDILTLSPHLSPASGAHVALSPHYIRAADERLFGKYNGGFVWTNDPQVLFEWRRATHTSRYFDQASLENVAKVFGDHVVEMPQSVNYGYWRMFQSNRTAPEEISRFSRQGGVITHDGVPLQSIHSHFFIKSASRSMQLFNRLMATWICDSSASSTITSLLSDWSMRQSAT